MVSEWQEPALEAAREDIFRLLDGLREVARSPGPGRPRSLEEQTLERERAERLELVRLVLIQALRLLEGNISIPRIPAEEWRHPIPEMPIPEGLSALLTGPAGDAADAAGARAAAETTYRAIARRLLLGPEVHRLMGGDGEWEPTVEEVVGWLRHLRDTDSGLLPWALVSVRLDHRALSILQELHLDQLLMAPEWSHPSQVFQRPRPPLIPLLEACVARLDGGAAGEDAQGLTAVREKLERAIRIEEAASRRRRNRKSRAKD